MIPNGALVFYKNKPALASRDKDRINLSFADRSSLRVRDKDVELLHPGPLAQLPTPAGPSSELEAAWEMTAGQRLSLDELCDLLYSVSDPASLLATRLLLLDSAHFSLDDQGIRSLSQEELQERLDKQQKREQAGAERADFLERAKKRDVRPEDQRYWGEIEAMALGQTAKSRTLAELGQAETAENAQRWLLATGLWTSHNNPHPSRARHPSRAPELDLPEATDRLPRLDLRHLPCWAIDNAWSHDPDDAIAIDGDTIWVHIADPAAVLTPDSPADLEAANRGATLYLPEGSVPMLPDAALDRFGLGLQAESPALSFAIRLDDKGLPAQIDIQPSLVRVQRLSYEAADSLLEGPEAPAALTRLAAIAAHRQAMRAASGAVDIAIPELRVWLDGDQIRLSPLPTTRSSGIVREMMILASEAAARWAFQRGLPFPYYSQEAPGSQDRLPEGLAGEFAKRRLMKAGKSGVQPHAHQGLGVTMYAQSSSPLRRYSDLLAHQQIRAQLGRELGLDTPAPLTADDLELRLAKASAQSAALRKAERASNLHWTLAWLLERPDWEGEGVVVQNGADSLVYIPELGLETRLKLPNQELNALVRLRFLKADLAGLEVYFAAAGQ